MLRKIIQTKQDPVLVLDLPGNLRGRRIELIAFAIEDEPEPIAVEPKAVTMADFLGTISSENAELLHQHAKQARNEWERDF